MRVVKSMVAFGMLAILVLGTAKASMAEDFGNQTTRIIVPFSPGGGTDVMGRTLAQELSKQINGTVIVENKPGAGTVIGSDYVARSEPDGHTLLMATFAHVVNPFLRAKLPYNADADFAPVSLLARSFNLVIVNPNSGIKSIADLIAAAKASKDGLNYGTFGVGTSAHLAGELFKSLTGTKMVAVHYKGAAPAITDLLAGNIQVMFTTVASGAAMVKAGKLTALAVTSAERNPAFPDLPTVAEAGVKGFVAESWYGVFAPAKTPRQTIAYLNAAIDKSIKSPMFGKLVENEGLTMVGGTPERLGEYVKEQSDLWRRVVKEAGIRAN